MQFRAFIISYILATWSWDVASGQELATDIFSDAGHGEDTITESIVANDFLTDFTDVEVQDGGGNGELGVDDDPTFDTIGGGAEFILSDGGGSITCGSVSRKRDLVTDGVVPP